MKEIHKQRVPCSLYTLNLRVKPEIAKEAKKLGVKIREYTVFHELLTDVLNSAGLEGPAKELAKMADDGATNPSPGMAPPPPTTTARPPVSKEASEAVDEGSMKAAVASMKVTELKAALSKLGMSTAGKKADLVARLKESKLL